MHVPKSPAAVGIPACQHVEPIPSESTGNVSNSVGGYQSTFGGTTAQVLFVNGC